MGEFKVHRVRFFDYMPTAIRAMAFNAHTERLALARMDGSVEIFNFTDHYFQEKVIPGKDSRSIESLCWVGGRLFSAGLNGEIAEYDLENLRPKYSLEAYGGPIWTIISNTQGTQLAIGCEDGTVKLFEVLEEHIQFERNLDRQKGKPGDRLPLKRKPEKLLLLKRKGEDHICCSALSSCGGWLAYSTVSSVRIYRLQTDNNNISITKVSKLPKALHSAHQLCFSSDSSKMFAASSQSSVLVIALTQSECKYVHTLKPKSGSRQPIHLMTTSGDGMWLAAANSDCEIHVYNLQKLKLHCIVPVYGSCPSAMGIHPTTNNMTVVHADQQLFEYSIVEKQYTDWSRKLQKQGLHNVWLDRDTPVTHVTFNSKNPNQVVLHDMHMFCIIDQSLPLPDQKTQFYNQMTLRSLSEQERPSHLHAFKICKTFQDLLCVSLLDDQSLVVVERPLLAITSQLPAPVRQKKFAT